MSYTNAAGYDFINASTVAVEYYAGGHIVPGGILNDQELEAGLRIDYAHVVMESRDGHTVFARSIMIGETAEAVAAMLRARGTIDDHCSIFAQK